jgi:hypothetical protein
MVTQAGSWNLIRREAGVVLISLAFLFPFTISSHASGPDESPLDAIELTQMEQRADSAQPRDQCWMFAEVLHGLTELAGRQMAAGDDLDADVTLNHMDSVAAKMQKSSAGNAKRLKNAEMLLDHITRRLTDMAHVATNKERGTMQNTLQCVNRLHTQVLNVIFAK